MLLEITPQLANGAGGFFTPKYCDLDCIIRDNAIIDAIFSTKFSL